MKNFFKWKNYFILYTAFLLILNLLLISLPLTNVFGYEFSAINAIAISFLSGIYILSSFRAKTDNSNPNLVALLTNLSILLVVPFVVSIINSFFTGFCSFSDGFLFYVVITVPSIIIGGALGIVATAIDQKFRWMIFILIFITLLLIAFFEIYFNPQVYLYNPVFGYFPGTIYDEGLSVDLKLFSYRLLNTIFFFAVFVLIHNTIKRKRRKAVVWRRISFSLLVALIFYFCISPVWGYSTTFSKLQKELPVKVETEHFIINADNGIDKSTLKFIAINQEYFYKKLSALLDESFDEKINSFIFKSSLQKKELFGSGNADVAKPWQNSVYVSMDSWESSLEHEIAHCFAGKFGWGIFKVAAGFNPALIEGVAEACDGFYDEMNIHFLASIAYKNNFKTNISNLFSGFSFFGNVSGLSYIYSGSFVKYLIEKFGVHKVKQYHRTNEFKASFDVEINEVENEYFQFLTDFTKDNWQAKANYYFGRQSLVQKICPRYISDRLADAWELINQEKYDEAEHYLRDILEKTDNYSAIVGLSLIYEKTDSLIFAIRILEDKIDQFSNTSYEYNLKFRIADLKVQAGYLNEAKKIYESLLVSKPNIRLELLAQIRLDLFKENKISRYVSGSDFDKYYLLKYLNSTEYEYQSIPIMINLSEALEENYKLFLSNLTHNFEVKDFFSSYASLKLSQYMLQNFDYLNARKMAGLSLRIKDENGLLELKKQNFQKAEWFNRNAERVLNEMKYSKN